MKRIAILFSLALLLSVFISMALNQKFKGNSAYVKLRGKGRYAGVKVVKFKIGAAPMEDEWSGVIMNLRDAFAW